MIGRFEGEWLIRNPTSATSGTWPRCLNLAQPPPVVVLFVMFLIGCMQSRATSLAKKTLDQESLQCFTVIRFAFTHSVEQTSKGVWVGERKGGGGSKKKSRRNTHRLSILYGMQFHDTDFLCFSAPLTWLHPSGRLSFPIDAYRFRGLLSRAVEHSVDPWIRCGAAFSENCARLILFSHIHSTCFARFQSGKATLPFCFAVWRVIVSKWLHFYQN